MRGSLRGWRALSDGFLLQDVVAAGVGEASEKRDEPAAGEAVSPAVRRVVSQGLAWHRRSQSAEAGAAGRGGHALGLGGRAALLGGEVA